MDECSTVEILGAVSHDGYSRCNTTIRPIMPNIAVFIHGFSDNMIVTYPTNGMYPTAHDVSHHQACMLERDHNLPTLPIMSCLSR